MELALHNHRPGKIVYVPESPESCRFCFCAIPARSFLFRRQVGQVFRKFSVQPVTAVQSEYSLWTRDVEQNGVLTTCEELGIGFVPWGPLGAGFLTGKIDATTQFETTDFRNISPRFTPEARAANQAVVDLLKSIGEKKSGSPAQIALAWLLAQKPWIVPIPGTTKLHRLEENLGAVRIQLSAEDLRDIDMAVSKIEIQGQRLPEAVLKMSEQ